MPASLAGQTRSKQEMHNERIESTNRTKTNRGSHHESNTETAQLSGVTERCVKIRLLRANSTERGEPEKPHALVCNEVRGGDRKFIGTRKLLGIAAWVASIPITEGDGGGDLHFMSVCSHDLISRVALADVSGHGREVDAAAMTLHKLMRENIDVWDQSDFMRGLNDTFNQYGGGQYATAIVLSFHRLTGQLAFSNAGHLPPLWYHASERAWGWLEEGDPAPRKAFGLPVGLIPGTDYCQTVVTLRRSDLLVLYTDGITDAENGAGKALGRQQLMEWAREGPLESPTILGEQLLKRLSKFHLNRHNDDETLVVLQREEESAPISE